MSENADKTGADGAEGSYPAGDPGDDAYPRRRRGRGLLLLILAATAIGGLWWSADIWAPAVRGTMENIASMAGVSPKDSAEKEATTQDDAAPGADGVGEQDAADSGAALDARLARLEAVAGALRTSLALNEERFATIDERFDRIEEFLGQWGQSGTDPAVLARLDALENARREAPKVSGQKPPAAETVARLDALEARLAEMSRALEVATETLARGRSHRDGLALALTQLRQRIADGRSYAAELQPFARFAAGDNEISSLVAKLRTQAEKGVPTLGDLRERLARDAPDILAAAAREDMGGDAASWIERTLARLRGLVSVRRVGDVAGDSAEAIVARAEDALENRDLARAIAEMDDLTGDAARQARHWLYRAKARLEVESVLAELDGLALSVLGDAAPPVDTRSDDISDGGLGGDTTGAESPARP